MPTKLTIAVCEVDKSGTVTGENSSKKFEVMLNPSSFTHKKSINYSGLDGKSANGKGKGELRARRRAQGVSAAMPQFQNTGSETLSFEITLDGTGVVGAYPDVKDQVQALSDIVYKYEGNTHEPNIVRLAWGTFSFDGRLTSMSTKYTLFKPSGEALRATVALDFTDYTSLKEEALKANKSSPDLTHLVEVKAGDSLPLLCYRIYKDSAYYLEVARINGITNFRDIKPGARLHFPPLR